MARPVDLDRLTAASIRDGALAGRRVTVLGLARSGIALARFFADAGCRVTVYDGRTAGQLAPAIESLGGRTVTLALGPAIDPSTAWADAHLIATSPSINPDYPTTEPRLRDALRSVVAAHAADPTRHPALVSEADLVLRLCPCPTIGVTGTKGKTTTSSLTATLLAADPAHPVTLGGNIGIPLIERVTSLRPEDRVVIELSELQLPTLSRGTTVAVYTNVTSDHIDRHGSLEAYRAVKRRLAELVDPGGAAVLNLDDPVVGEYRVPAGAAAVPYRLGEPLPGGVGFVDNWIVAANVPVLAGAGAPPRAGEAPRSGRGSTSGPILPVAELAIPGRHNVSNAMAAVAAALLFGVEPAAIRRAAAAFTGVEHRLERVAVVDGVQFVNDSQGTQPDAVVAALEAFDRPLVLIAGGRDKGNDLREMAAVAAARADAAVLIGESGPAIGELLRGAGMGRVSRAETLEAAVADADALARELLRGAAPGATATVLMSPAAASFDMFVDYAARGAAFKAAVAALAAERRVAADLADGAAPASPASPPRPSEPAR
jgi:UDP-N-acetylmuramoylalanine--D-glutamate ligase